MQPGWDTWQGNAVEFGGGSTWLTGSYDPELRLLYWPTGNPFPDGRQYVAIASGSNVLAFALPE
jgi:glucose dehydrogenase